MVGSAAGRRQTSWGRMTREPCPSWPSQYLPADVPNKQPPPTPSGAPAFEDLPADKILWRIHPAKFHATEFNDTASANPDSGGRFDSANGEYAYLYAGDTVGGALVETLLRDIPLADAGTPRVLPAVALQRRMLTRVRVARPITLVSLHGPGLSKIGQDGWLTSCDAIDYAFTRAWAESIRVWAPDAGGFVWRSRLDDSKFSLCVFRRPTHGRQSCQSRFVDAMRNGASQGPPHSCTGGVRRGIELDARPRQSA